MLESIYIENQGDHFAVHALPRQAQFAPIYAMAVIDYNRDGKMDLIVAGNQSSIRIRVGVIDANFGQLYEGDGKGNFTYVDQTNSGLQLTGDTKSLQVIPVNGESYLMIGTNNVGINTYRINSKDPRND
jgi:hypothetical protein